jgi:undecaprenyl-diphosphatase
MKTKKLISLCAIFLLIFVLILLGVSFNLFVGLDNSVNSFMLKTQNPFIVDFSNTISTMFGVTSVVIVSLNLTIYFFYKFPKIEPIFFASSMLFTGIIMYALKSSIQRPRPLNALVHETTFAFPSSHAATSIVFFGLLTYLILRKSKSKALKSLSIPVSIFIVLIISFARLCLNVHWMTDVLGGLAIGAAILTGSIFVRKSLEK